MTEESLLRQIIEILAATLVATSAMTGFSYLISESFQKLYKEPVLLKWLMKSFHFQLSAFQQKIAAWCLHYAIGLLFVIGYYFPVWLEWGWYKINWLSGLLFGGIIGLIGISGWEIMFRLSPKNPPLDTKGYYFQLYLAHLIFGLATVATHLGFNFLSAPSA